MRGLILAAMLLAVHAAAAAPPPDADPTLAPWYDGLRQPHTNILCCSIADCRPVQSRLRHDHYEALIEGAWLPVPDDKVLLRSDNPTGHAVVCWTEPTGILCFVPAPES